MSLRLSSVARPGFKKSSLFFAKVLFLGALSLTGCATGRYDKVAGIAAVPALTPALPLSKPLTGVLITPFGGRESGVLSKGVWLEGQAGQAVVAAADGRVAFEDERMEGYGRTVILEHPGGLWTVYAHLGTTTVKPGDVVLRGREVGRLDGVEPRIYFEFRRGDRAEDPVKVWM